MKTLWIAAAAGALLATPSLAGGHLGSGDPAAGESVFNQCQSCHVVADDDGNVLAGRNGRTGPNLYGVIGRAAGMADGFRYRPDIVKAGEEGLVWDAEKMAAYLLDPSGYLSEVLGSRARSGMSFRVRSEEDAANVTAYIASLAPPPEG